ncbi:MAG: hypothetical protein EA360_05655, partial [Balneolaceae bacterium]
SLILEYKVLGVRNAMVLFSLILIASGIFWLMKVAPAEKTSLEEGISGNPLNAQKQEKAIEGKEKLLYDSFTPLK